jgi:hypothetical protein
VHHHEHLWKREGKEKVVGCYITRFTLRSSQHKPHNLLACSAGQHNQAANWGIPYLIGHVDLKKEALGDVCGEAGGDPAGEQIRVYEQLAVRPNLVQSLLLL